MALMQNWKGEEMRATGSWLARASEDETIFAARVVVFAYAAEEEDDLLMLAVLLSIPAAWGETTASLRARILRRSRTYFRLRQADLPEPELHWWARLVQELPVSWRPLLRKAIDRLRGRGRRT